MFAFEVVVMVRVGSRVTEMVGWRDIVAKRWRGSGIWRMGKGPLPSALYSSLYIRLYLLFSHSALKVLDFFGKLLLRWWVRTGQLAHGASAGRPY